MMTSGIVVQFDPGSPQWAVTRQALCAIPSFTLGREREARLPLALEARDALESEHWLGWLCGMPGVAGAEVVFVHWDDAEVTGA